MKNLVICELFGLNLDNVLNTLKSKDIKIYNITKNANCNYKITINHKNYTKIVKICNNFGIECKKLKEYGINNLIKTVLQRIGIFIGVCISILFVLFFSGFVWQVEVRLSGTQTELINDKIMLEYLSNKDVSIGKRINSIDVDDVERDILLNYPTISNVQVEKRGVKVYVYGDIIQEYEDNEKNAICADKDGIIEEIRLNAGNIVVQIGNVVRKGDVIIEPDINGVCSADVYIKTWVTAEEVGFTQREILNRTGRCETQHTLLWALWNKTDIVPRCDFEYYDVEIEENCVCNNLFLPVFTSTATYYELKKVTENISMQDLVTKIEEKLTTIVDDESSDSLYAGELRFNVYENVDSVRVVASREIIYKLA